MPGNNGVGLHDLQRRAPLRPHAGKPYLEQSIRVVQWRAFLCRALQNSDLMAQRNVFQPQSSAALHRGPDHGRHHRDPFPCRTTQLLEPVQPSSSQPVPHLRESQFDRAKKRGAPEPGMGCASHQGSLTNLIGKNESVLHMNLLAAADCGPIRQRVCVKLRTAYSRAGMSGARLFGAVGCGRDEGARRGQG